MVITFEITFPAEPQQLAGVVYMPYDGMRNADLGVRSRSEQ